MSPCPACGAQGHHVAIVLPWNAAEKLPPGKRLLVQHACPRTNGCPQGTWYEAATDEPALLRRITRALAPSPLEAILAGPAKEATPAGIAATLREGGLTDADLLLHASAWMVFGRFGVTEENRREVHSALLSELWERAPTEGL